jgi:hypothetical protein
MLQWQKFRKSALGLTPGEDGFCILETKHDRRTSQRPKLCVATRGLQEQRPQPRKTVPDLSPGEDDFCNSKAKHDRRMAQSTQLLVTARRLQELRSQTRKLPWVRVSVRMYMEIVI